ncbi:hypothetical protein VTL71DRAFT_2321, partial [Oculimacula yallundae]
MTSTSAAAGLLSTSSGLVARAGVAELPRPGFDGLFYIHLNRNNYVNLVDDLSHHLSSIVVKFMTSEVLIYLCPVSILSC